MTTQFIERMTHHWKATLSRPCTNALAEGWQQLEQALETSSSHNQWQVVQLPTGTGKTEALIVLCAKPSAQHPGALIVTRFRDEADRIARAINVNAGSMVALAIHANASAPSIDITQSPVLVITHAAYAGALREALDRPDAPVRLSLYRQYHQATRQWFIVDEAFNWIDAYEADLGDLMAMCGALCGMLSSDISECLQSLTALVQSLSEGQNTDRSDRLLAANQNSMLKAVDISQLRLAIRDLPTDATEVWRDTELRLRTADLQPTTYKKQYIGLLERLLAIQQIGHAWLSQRGRRVRLHSARSLLSAAHCGGIILDATASIDRSYDLLGNSVALVPRPCSIRSYENVAVHVSHSHKVGKEYLSKHAHTDWPSVARQLSKHLTSGNKVLVITHKDVVPVVRKHGLRCGMLDVQHWGALDGKNRWMDYDTVVVFGLPYLDDIAPTNIFLACAVSNSSDWFSGRRQYGCHADMKTAIKSSFISKSLVQAINRVRCRTITDDQGNCEATDVFMLLPSGDTADAVTVAIAHEMPGSRLMGWCATPEIRKPMARSEQRLLMLLRNSEPGTYSKSLIISRLSITSRTFERMSVNMQKSDSVLMRELVAIGVAYDCAIGRGKEACFIKQ